jgi:signal transduction histidine kinase
MFAILDLIPAAVAISGAGDGIVRYGNEELRTVLRPTGDVTGRQLDEVLGAPGAHAAIIASVAAVVRTGAILGTSTNPPTSHGVELEVRRGSGESTWLVAESRRLVSGVHRGAILTMFRTAAQKHGPLEPVDAPRSALELLAELPEKNPGPVCRLARDGTVLMANAAARRFLGAEHLRGLNWIDVCPGMTRRIWGDVLGLDDRISIEVERGGTDILFTYIRSETGDLVFAYGADITARRRSERLLAEQAARLAEVARFPEMNPGPVMRVDDETGSVLMANAAARDVFGEEIVGRAWRDLCLAIDDHAWRRILGSTSTVPLEARIGGRDFVFAHRYDVDTGLVFVFGADISAQKQAEHALRQSERMATLGTLAAGVAHELNNPAAAARRAAQQLRDAFARLEDARFRLEAATMPQAAWRNLQALETQAREHSAAPSDLAPLDRADREDRMEGWLDDHGVADPWNLVGPLVAQGLDESALEDLAEMLDTHRLTLVLSWTAAAFHVYSLAHEIGEGASRISEIVGALKSYSYLGQAPVQLVDIREGLDNTLVILRNKLKAGIEVQREYGSDVPPITAFGSELNQVWTNLLDNAADALGGRGRVTIRTRRDGDWAVVEITDDGPGITDDVRSRVFDPFFTTKEPGKGTGLGLSTSFSIVTEKHHGSITVQSRPGETTFTVRLPIEMPMASAPASMPD